MYYIYHCNDTISDKLNKFMQSYKKVMMNTQCKNTNEKKHYQPTVTVTVAAEQVMGK